MGDWTFFSNYGHVLVCLARNSDARLRDVALEVGITERAVQKIVRDLQDAGYLEVTKRGRCNRYRINRRKSLRHDLQSHVTVGKLLSLVAGAEPRLPRAEEPVPLEEVSAVETQELSATELPSKTETVSVPEQGPGPELKPEPEQEQEPKSARKESSKSGPVDTRQQGNLF